MFCLENRRPMWNSRAVFNDAIIYLEKEVVHLSHASPMAAPKLMMGILEEQVLMPQKDNFTKEWSPDGKKILGRHSNRKKSANDKGKDVVEGSIKTRCIVGSDQWFLSSVPQNCLKEEETEATETVGLHYGTSFLPLYPIRGTEVPLTCSHNRLLLWRKGCFKPQDWMISKVPV